MKELKKFVIENEPTCTSVKLVTSKVIAVLKEMLMLIKRLKQLQHFPSVIELVSINCQHFRFKISYYS